ncbi:glycosyltransferase 87 family protein [Gordonia caeni]|uniref:Glycosyltransferase 87 family protein n=1 Tax=Gordonia caeni TaxID=1007097 RepID=A0ABP7P6P2_9ACTN
MPDEDLPERPLRTVARSVVVVSCALAAGAIAWHLLVMPIYEHGYGLFTNGIDTKVYRGAAQAVLDGRPLYDEPVFKVWRFTYAPFGALVMLPLGLLGRWEAMRVMEGVNVLCLALLVFLSLRALGLRRDDARFWGTTAALTIAVSVLEPVRTTIWNGQINLVLAVLVVGCLTLPLGRWRGIGVGVAAGIKLTPLFFLCYLAVTRQWRAAVVVLATFAATVLIGLAVLRDEAWRFWTGTLNDTSRIGPLDAIANQSFHGFFVRLGTLGVWQAPDWLWLPVGVVLAVLGLYTVWRAHRAGATLLAVTLTGMTACAVSPFSWGHHWVWVVPLMVIALVTAGGAARRDRPVTWLWWLLPAGIAAAMFSWHVQLMEDGRAVYRFGSYRLFWQVDAHGWHAAAAVIGSGAYLWVFLAALAVTLWWTGRVDPIRFNPNAVTPAETAR